MLVMFVMFPVPVRLGAEDDEEVEEELEEELEDLTGGALATTKL